MIPVILEALSDALIVFVVLAVLLGSCFMGVS